MIKNKTYNEYTTRTNIKCKKYIQAEYENSNVRKYCNKYTCTTNIDI